MPYRDCDLSLPSSHFLRIKPGSGTFLWVKTILCWWFFTQRVVGH